MPRSNHAPLEERDARDYPILELLDRLEVLLEEMDELGVSSREEIEQRMAELEAQLEDLDASDEEVATRPPNAGSFDRP